MKKNVNLILTGIQYDAAGQKTVTEFSCAAEYYLKNGSHYIFYEEEADTGLSVRCTLKLKGNRLEQQKKGALASLMVFEPNKEYVTQYMTPLGSLPLELFTRRLEAAFGESEIVCTAEYLLASEGQPLSRNMIIIKIIDCKD